MTLAAKSELGRGSTFPFELELPRLARRSRRTPAGRGRCPAAGMDDYVTEPMRAQALSDTLARWVGRDAAVAA